VASAYLDGPPPHPGFVFVIFQDPLSPGSFPRISHFRVGTDPQALAIGDLNDDGLPDLVTANSTSNSISILFQDPSTPGNFLGANNLATGTYPNDVAIDDLDGDGVFDFAVADHDLSIFYQDPLNIGTFLPRVSLGVRSGSVAIGDLDGDLMLDIAVTQADTNVKVLLQDPATPGTFLPAVGFAAGDQPISIAIGDLNADTLPDLAVANYGPPSGPGPESVSVLLQDPATPGSFLPTTNYITTTGRNNEVAIGDLNDDGRPDLAAASGIWDGDGFVSLLFQDPATPGAFLPTVNLEIDFQVVSVAIGDLNEDTLNDLAVADWDVYIRFQDPANPGSFLPRLRVLED
jgi:hypothetical protein